MSTISAPKTLLLSFVVAIGATALAAPADAQLNILLTNDDGYGSNGITIMQAALEGAGHTVYVSAPASQQSGKSGSITADFGAEIGFTEEAPGKAWSVEGTPADSVSAGLFGLTPDVLPPGEDIDLIVSGANDGENVSRFTNASGTVGAAMWGLRRGVPAIAVSVGQDITALAMLGRCRAPSPPPDPTGCDCDFGCLVGQSRANEVKGANTAAALTVAIIDELGEDGIPEGLGLNVNVPSGRFDPVGNRITRSDNVQAFDLVIAKNDEGNLEVDSFTVSGILAGLLTSAVPVQACPGLPLDLDSEGAAFACAYNTITTLNGNFDSSQDDTDASKDLACALVGLAELPSFWDEPNNRNGNKNICKHR